MSHLGFRLVMDEDTWKEAGARQASARAAGAPGIAGG
jgi:hypothetical protein